MTQPVCVCVCTKKVKVINARVASFCVYSRKPHPRYKKERTMRRNVYRRETRKKNKRKKSKRKIVRRCSVVYVYEYTIARSPRDSSRGSGILEFPYLIITRTYKENLPRERESRFCRVAKPRGGSSLSPDRTLDSRGSHCAPTHRAKRNK